MHDVHLGDELFLLAITLSLKCPELNLGVNEFDCKNPLLCQFHLNYVNHNFLDLKAQIIVIDNS